MADTLTDMILDALTAAARRRPMATAMGSGELREMAARFRMNAVFTARGTSAVYASALKRVVDLLAGGTIGEADARVTLLETLKALGYTPEGGFPAAPAGAVPPAVRGTLEDLSSFRRLDLIVRTQADLMAGAGLQYRGQEPDRLRAAPAWELIRGIPVREPRDWGGMHDGTPPKRAGGAVDDRSRWVIAGGTPRPDGRLIALKGDPIWGELGSSGNFSDALDVDHPPFAYNSGMVWREVLRREVTALGITGPNGETLAEWEAGERPRTIRGALPIPDPAMSTRGLDPDIIQAITSDPETETVPGTETVRPAGSTSRAERRAAREARSAERWAAAAKAARREEALYR